MYDASIARWNGVDALSEKYQAWSPYNYVLGNPVFFIDPDGNSATIPDIVFNGKRLYYRNDNGKVLWSIAAKSGNGKYLNNPKYQNVMYDGKIGGPIPSGSYFIRLNSKKRLLKGDKQGRAWGKYAIRLDYGTRQAIRLKWYYNNRSGFFLHEDGNEEDGGDAIGTAGCIACFKGPDILKFKNILLSLFEDGEKAVEVIVDYNFNVSKKDQEKDKESKKSTESTHTVRNGETLYRLAKRNNTTVERLLKLNPSINRKTYLIKTGQEILLSK